MSNVEALLELAALQQGGLGGVGSAPGRLSEQSTGLKRVEPYDGTPEHRHPIALTQRNQGWSCDVCGQSGSGMRRYRCTGGCDWDMCGSCWDTKTAEHARKYASMVGDDADKRRAPPVMGGGNRALSNPWSGPEELGRQGPLPEWSEQNPLARVLSAKPSTSIEDSCGPSGDIEPYLLERHLWSESGLSREALQRACKQLAGAAHSVLVSQYETKDAIGKTLKAQTAALKKLEKSIAAELRGKPGVPLLVTTPEPIENHGVGDTSGLFYYLGTGCGTRAYSNPSGNGLLLTKGGDGTGDPRGSYDYGSGEALLSNSNSQRVRLYDNYSSQGEHGRPWFQVQITAPDVFGFLPTHYKIRAGDSTEYLLRQWQFKGSEDGKDWTVLGSGSEHPGAFSRPEQCKTFPVTGAKAFYKYFRIEQGAQNVRLDLKCWEIYGFMPARTGRSALKDAIKCLGLETTATSKERPTEEIFSNATIEIGLHMLDHLIQSTADAPLAANILSTVVSSLQAMKPRSLHDSNRPAAVSSGQLDAVQDFLCRALPKTAAMAPQCFEQVVTGLELFAARRGRLRDILVVLSALDEHTSTSSLAASRYTCIAAELEADCSRAAAAQDGVTLTDSLVDPCLGSLTTIASLLEACAEEDTWSASSVAWCWLALENLKTATMKMTEDEIALCEELGSRFQTIAVALYDKQWPAVQGEDGGGVLRRSLLIAAVGFRYETSKDPAQLVDSALEFELGHDTPASALVVFTAVLDSVDNINKTVCLLGSAKGADAATNLMDHKRVISFTTRVLQLSQAITDSANFQPMPEAPPAAAMIGLLARVQAAIWSDHRTRQDEGTYELLNVYTTALFRFAIQQFARPSAEHGRIFAGPVGGLLPTWVAVINAEDWSKWQDETLGTIQLCFEGLLNASHAARQDSRESDNAALSYQKSLLQNQPQYFRGCIQKESVQWSPSTASAASTVHFPGASAIRAQFDSCFMPKGCRVEVTLANEETATFTGGVRTSAGDTPAIDWTNHSGSFQDVAAVDFLSDQLVFSVKLPDACTDITLSDETPIEEQEAAMLAKALGFKLGGGGYEFAGNYSAKGLYSYASGKFAGMAFFGRDGSPESATSAITPGDHGKHRIWPPRMQCTLSPIHGLAPPSTARRWIANLSATLAYSSIANMMQLGTGEACASKEPSKALRNLIGKDRGTPAPKLVAIASNPTEPSVGRIISESFQAAGVPTPDSTAPEDSACAAVFACLLHHGGLAAAVEHVAEQFESGDLALPDALIEAAKHAHGILHRVQQAAEDLSADAETRGEWLSDIRSKASFLLQFKASLGSASTDASALSKTVSAQGRTLTRASSSAALQRALSDGPSLKRAKSDISRWSGALAKLQSVSRLQTVRGISTSTRQVFADISTVLFDNSISTDALDKGADSAEARCKERLRGYQFVSQMLKRADAETANTLRKLTGLRLLDPTGGSQAEHYLALGAAGSTQLMEHMTESYWGFLVEIGLLDDSQDQKHDLLNIAPALCCIWREWDWLYIAKHGLYRKLKEGAKNGVVRGDGLIMRILKLCMMLAAASASEKCEVLESMVDVELETVQESDSIVALSLSLPSSYCSINWLANADLRSKFLEYIFTLADPQAGSRLTHTRTPKLNQHASATSETSTDSKQQPSGTVWLPMLNRCLRKLCPATIDAASVSLAQKIGADTPEQIPPGTQLVALLANIATIDERGAVQLPLSAGQQGLQMAGGCSNEERPPLTNDLAKSLLRSLSAISQEWNDAVSYFAVSGLSAISNDKTADVRLPLELIGGCLPPISVGVLVDVPSEAGKAGRVVGFDSTGSVMIESGDKLYGPVVTKSLQTRAQTPELSIDIIRLLASVAQASIVSLTPSEKSSPKWKQTLQAAMVMKILMAQAQQSSISDTIIQQLFQRNIVSDIVAAADAGVSGSLTECITKLEGYLSVLMQKVKRADIAMAEQLLVDVSRDSSYVGELNYFDSGNPEMEPELEPEPEPEPENKYPACWLESYRGLDLDRIRSMAQTTELASVLDNSGSEPSRPGYSFQIVGSTIALTDAGVQLALVITMVSIGDGTVFSNDNLGDSAIDTILLNAKGGEFKGTSKMLDDEKNIWMKNLDYTFSFAAGTITVQTDEFCIDLVETASTPVPHEAQRLDAPVPPSEMEPPAPYELSLLLDQRELFRGCVTRAVSITEATGPETIKAENKTMRGDWLSEAIDPPKTTLGIPVMESNADQDVLLHLNQVLRCLGSCYSAQVAFKALEHMRGDSSELVANPDQCNAVVKLLCQGHRNLVPTVLDGSVADSIIDSAFHGDNLDASAKHLLVSQQDAILSVVSGTTKIEPLCVQTLESNHHSSYGFGEDGCWEATLAFPDAKSTRVELDDRCDLDGSGELTLVPRDAPDGTEPICFSANDNVADVGATTIPGCSKLHWKMRNTSSSCWGAKVTLSAATTSAVVESRHEYEPNLDFVGSVCIQGANTMQVKFDSSTRTESGCDTLRFYHKNPREGGGSPVHEFNGDNSRFNNFTWKSNTLYYRFNSDGSCQYWGFKFTVTAGTVDSIPPSLVPQMSIASMLFESIARRKFAVAKDLLLSDKSLRMLKLACYKTSGVSRRNMLKLIEAVIDGATETQTAVPDELARTVCNLYEKAFEESQDDKFGNASVSGLAALALRLAGAGWIGFFGTNDLEPEPEPEQNGGAGSAETDIADLRRQAITSGMPFRTARDATATSLTDFIEAASTPQELEWTHSATYQNQGEWVLDGKLATLSGGNSNNGYNIVAVGIPFPNSPGPQQATVTISASSTLAVGVCASFEELVSYGSDSYTWIGNGPRGWSLCSDGDGCHNGSWLGGDYSRFAYRSGAVVTVTIEGDDRTISWEVGGQMKSHAYRNLPSEVYLTCAIQGSGSVEIGESFADGAKGHVASAFDALAELHLVSEAVEALNSSQPLPPPLRLVPAEGVPHVVDARRWISYVREYFVARKSQQIRDLPAPPDGWMDTPPQPSWGWPEDLTLLNLIAAGGAGGGTPILDSVDLSKPEIWDEVCKWGDEETKAFDELLAKKYRVLEGRRELVVRRAPLLCRFLPMLRQLLPMMTMENWYSCRDMLPKKLRHKMLQPLLVKARRTGPQPSIRINRQMAMGVDNSSDGSDGYNTEKSIFVQVYKTLGDYARSDAIFRGSSEKWFSVTLEGEHASDAGGVFRETISNISDDLMSDRTPLFIRTPNNIEQVGDLRDVWMPNPSCQRFDLYEFVGRLMAGAIQTDENLVVQLSPFVWRRIGGAPCTVEQYTAGVNESLGNYLKCADMDEDTFEFCCNTYSLKRSDGTLLDLVPGGSEVEVLFSERSAWLEMVKAAYITEVDAQCAAIRRGLLSAAIPLPYLALTSSDSLELAIAGAPEITLDGIQKHTSIYLDEQQTEMFWACVEAFTMEERSRLLKFATGRIRLPVALKIEANGCVVTANIILQ